MRIAILVSALFAAGVAQAATPLTSVRCGTAWNASSTAAQRAHVMAGSPIGAFLNPGTIDIKVGSAVRKQPACFAMFVSASRTIIYQGVWGTSGVPTWAGPRINTKPFTLPVNSVVRANGTVVVHTR
ncbi:MAG: hypothetical protein F2663_01630 [Actinobacteria bacterium]|uniref:Unannotated protein n=1 Tax=freshwater metagenome TaxID=449393 RepID=A0A6J6NHZ2_9ZZZZ|nr:hypothetical protein [Actinomycetota bacterium]